MAFGKQLYRRHGYDVRDDAAICGLPVNIQFSKNLLVLISSGGNFLLREPWLLLYSSNLFDTRLSLAGGGPG